MWKAERLYGRMSSSSENIAESEVVYANGSEEPTIILQFTATDDTDYTEKVRFVVGGASKQTDKVVDLFGDEDGKRTAMVLGTPEEATGYYISLCEIYGIDEHTAKEQIRRGLDENGYPNWVTEYEHWKMELNNPQAQLRLLDQAEADAESTPFYDDVLDRGSWRETGLSGVAKRRAEKLRSDITVNPRKCYKNAQRAFHAYTGESSEITYVEGIALSEHGVRITGHGWVELDGKVVEVTWPWHSISPTGAVYFGVEVPDAEVPEPGTEQFSNPVVLNWERDQAVDTE